MITPDDKRHGTNAGYVADCRCDPCNLASYRYHKAKRARLNSGVKNRITLGNTAWELIRSTPRSALAELTGIKPHKLSQYLTSGPDTPVLRSTRNNIIASATGTRVVTAIGVQRRIRALHRLGWGAPAIADAATMHVESIKDIRRIGHTPHFVARKVAQKIATVYEDMSMRTPEPSRATTKTRRWAERNDWPPPAAWEEIDDPNETPADAYRSPRNPNDVDPVTVIRFFEGDRSMPTTRAEKQAITAEWVNRGGSIASLGRTMGWQAERYKPEDAA